MKRLSYIEDARCLKVKLGQQSLCSTSGSTINSLPPTECPKKYALYIGPLHQRVFPVPCGQHDTLRLSTVCYAYCEIELSLPVVTCALFLCSRLLEMPVVAQLVQKFNAFSVVRIVSVTIRKRDCPNPEPAESGHVPILSRSSLISSSHVALRSSE